jgi:hypothetical protein
MSFLSDLIDEILPKLGSPTQILADEIRGFKKTITQSLDLLNNENNLRIYEDNKGGVIRGPKASRRQNRREDNNGVLLCDKVNFDCCSEVSYFRALFNFPGRSFSITPETKVNLIGFESPVMRKVTDRKNPNIKSRTIACDLVGLTSDNRVLCIEGKVKPHSEATNIVYGLLESFAYSVCIEYFLSDKTRLELFKKEVQMCLNEFHPNAIRLDNSKLTAAFTLAAPREYFAEYFNPIQTGANNKHRNLKEQVAIKLVEAKKLLAALRETNGPSWAGFLIMTPPCIISSFEQKGGKTHKLKEYVEPHFAPESLNVVLAEDIDALKIALEA